MTQTLNLDLKIYIDFKAPLVVLVGRELPETLARTLTHVYPGLTHMASVIFFCCCLLHQK